MTFDKHELSFLLQGCVPELFNAIGIDLTNYYVDEREIRGPCPVHAGDNTTAFVCYIRDSRWFCFTHACHDEKGCSLVGLVAIKLGMAIPNACRWVQKFLKDKGITNEKTALLLRTMRSKKQEKIDYWKKHLRQRTFNNSVLNRLLPPIKFAQLRHLDCDVLCCMGAGYAERGRMRNRVVFPIRNYEGKMVGFTGRYHALRSGNLPKWLHLPKKFGSSINLFNIDRAAKYIKRTGTVIIGEGPLEVVKLEMAGYRNAVAVLGLRVSKGHSEILRHCNAIYTVLAFDPDRVDSAPVRDNIARLQENDFDVRVLRWDGMEDIGAMEILKVHRVLKQVQDIPTFHTWRIK